MLSYCPRGIASTVSLSRPSVSSVSGWADWAPAWEPIFEFQIVLGQLQMNWRPPLAFASKFRNKAYLGVEKLLLSDCKFQLLFEFFDLLQQVPLVCEVVGIHHLVGVLASWVWALLVCLLNFRHSAIHLVVWICLPDLDVVDAAYYPPLSFIRLVICLIVWVGLPNINFVDAAHYPPLIVVLPGIVLYRHLAFQFFVSMSDLYCKLLKDSLLFLQVFDGLLLLLQLLAVLDFQLGYSLLELLGFSILQLQLSILLGELPLELWLLVWKLLQLGPHLSISLFRSILRFQLKLCRLENNFELLNLSLVLLDFLSRLYWHCTWWFLFLARLLCWSC